MNYKATATYKKHFKMELPLIAIIISLLFYEVVEFKFMYFNLALWDVLTVFLVIYLFLFYRESLILHPIWEKGLIVLLLYMLWMLFQAHRSPIPLKGWTMLIMFFRNIVILVLTSSIIYSSRLKKFNEIIETVCVVIALLSIVLYFISLNRLEIIIDNPTLWRPEPRIGYLLDQGGVLRLIGFAKDPNFYSLWMTPALFISIDKLQLRAINILKTLVILTSIILAYSRTYILVALVFSIGISLFVIYKYPNKIKYCKLLKNKKIIVYTIILIIVVAILFVHFNVFSVMMKRFGLSTPRWSMWQKIILSDTNLLLGNGLRSNQLALEGAYSHNSYLDIVYETGIIGLFFWTLIFLLTAFSLPGMNRDARPWLGSFVISLGMMMSFSIFYMPFIWIVKGVIIGSKK